MAQSWELLERMPESKASRQPAMNSQGFGSILHPYGLAVLNGVLDSRLSLA